MYLYGASGHGKVIKEILDAQNRDVEGFIDDNLEIETLCGLPVLHSVENIGELIVSIGSNPIRKKIVNRLNVVYPKAAIHPSAIISPSSEVGEGSVIMAGSILNAEVKVGRHCIINTNASIDHECVINDYVHIAPHCAICGQVKIGEGTLVGVNASIIPRVKIGKWCVIGAGSVVVDDIPDGYLAYGNPCKLIRIINNIPSKWGGVDPYYFCSHSVKEKI